MDEKHNKKRKRCITKKCKEWLRSNLVIDTNDTEFLLRKEKLFVNTTKHSDEESQVAQRLSSENKNDIWHDNKP